MKPAQIMTLVNKTMFTTTDPQTITLEVINKIVKRMSPWRMHKETYSKLRTKVGPWFPIGMSSKNRNIQLDEILLTRLYWVTGNFPYRHAAVACGMKRSKICEICQLSTFKGKWTLQRIHQIANYGRSLNIYQDIYGISDIYRKKQFTKYILGCYWRNPC